MSTHDSITRYGPGRTWRAPWRLAWRLLRACVPWRRAAARPVRLGRRGRRRLSAIERALVMETPQLASMFQMFAQLAVGESHDGAERLPRSVRSLPRPRRVHLALLFAFASLVALCVTLSFRVTPSSRNCLASTSSASSASSASPGSSPSPAFRAGGAAAFAPMRMAGCHAYPANSK
jgi:hypothetical protein